jgi:3-methyl-2-oxobutanoate hydroxymethyltransferase
MSNTKGRSVPEIMAYKADADHPPLVMVTAYDEPGARFADAAGVDLLLVGDSVATTVYGHKDTLHIALTDIVRHVEAVAAANPKALIVADLPWMSYHTNTTESVKNAARLVRAGAKGVKLEGGAIRVPVIEALLHAEIPVMGHLGLTPQSVLAMGGYRVQAKDEKGKEALISSAKALEAAGCFGVVLEGIPDSVAQVVTNSLSIPTIGIGAGARCDGQVLVYHDLLGLSQTPRPKFVRTYLELGPLITQAIAHYADDVRNARFPSDDETYHATTGQ